MNNFDQTYSLHIERIIQIIPEYENLLRSILLKDNFIKNLGLAASVKTQQTQDDKQYHNTVIGFNIPNDIISYEVPRFVCFEIGATHSLDAFKNYWITKQYDDYKDYVAGAIIKSSV